MEEKGVNQYSEVVVINLKDRIQRILHEVPTTMDKGEVVDIILTEVDWALRTNGIHDKHGRYLDTLEYEPRKD